MKPLGRPALTSERIAWFADYYRKHSTWGAFHVSLDDGNWKLGASLEFSCGEPGEEEAIEWFNQLTPTQRRKLRSKAQAMVQDSPPLTPALR